MGAGGVNPSGQPDRFIKKIELLCFSKASRFSDLGIMPLSNCCGCGSLKTGTLLIGLLNLLTSILGILISSWCVVDSRVSIILSRLYEAFQ